MSRWLKLGVILVLTVQMAGCAAVASSVIAAVTQIVLPDAQRLVHRLFYGADEAAVTAADPAAVAELQAEMAQELNERHHYQCAADLTQEQCRELLRPAVSADANEYRVSMENAYTECTRDGLASGSLRIGRTSEALRDRMVCVANRGFYKAVLAIIRGAPWINAS